MRAYLATGLLCGGILASCAQDAPRVPLPPQDVAEYIGERMRETQGIVPRSEVLDVVLGDTDLGDACLTEAMLDAEFYCAREEPCTLSETTVILGRGEAYLVTHDSPFSDELYHRIGWKEKGTDIPATAEPYLDDILDARELHASVRESLRNRFKDNEPSQREFVSALIDEMGRRDPRFYDGGEEVLAGRLDWRSVEQALVLEFYSELRWAFRFSDGPDLPEGFETARITHQVAKITSCQPLKGAHFLPF